MSTPKNLEKNDDQLARDPLADVPEQIQVRKKKREQMLAQGRDPYPAELPITHTIHAVRERFSALEPGVETEEYVGIAGRVVLMRPSGKIAFVVLQAGDGERLQAIFSLANVGKDALDALKAEVDLGDFLFVHGYVGTSKRGELSVFAAASSGSARTAVADSEAGADADAVSTIADTGTGADAGTASFDESDGTSVSSDNAADAGDAGKEIPAWMMASKALRPLPKTYVTESGEEMALNEETRVRKRHLDLITRQSARDMIRIRAAVMRSIRRTFEERGYLEIETPILQTLHGGAAARPFTTHINAYDEDLYLRIATELYLKRAVVGGVDRVFEIGKNFRNEGADSSHSPEFSALEAYQAYATYDTMAELTRAIVQNAALDAFGTLQVTLADGSVYDLSGEWTNLDLYTSLSEAVGEQIDVHTPREQLVQLAQAHGIKVKDYAVNGKIAEDIWEELVGSKLYAPTFVRDFPEDTSPLTRYHRSKPGLTEKWDLYIRGTETATAYSELADPVVQRERLTAQSLEAANGDPEAMQLDEDFIEAMEQGFPPTGGMGMGIDRLLMALTGLGIRETIAFPFVKQSS
ncbi:MAG: lysine--tRNA ligase [Actinomycetaceae bacterium]|nr:lysine--tRNA ligase [Actinomycetaceae bacterium]MDY5854178.1 lysine--tRNA ligase [Arcanobacterium sp.]